MKNRVVNTILLLASIAITIVLAEFIVRLIVAPVDYLEARLEADPVLTYRIVSNSGGHDAWGYRNPTIPDKVDIVAIGDSMTYGITAPASQSWSSHLKLLTGKTTYNFGVSGYSPLHYLHLLTNKAKLLDPELVIIGLYTGNDLIDSYNFAYSNANWHHFRSSAVDFQKDDTIELPFYIRVQLEKELTIRQWLLYHSVLYRMFTSSFIGGVIQQKHLKPSSPNHFLLATDNSANIGFVKERLSSLDLNDNKVKEGLTISLLALQQIQRYSMQNNMKLLVVIIPTKENVYAQLLRDTADSVGNKSIEKLLNSEAEVISQFVRFFDENDIQYVQPLQLMRQAAADSSLYPEGFETHPNGKGYQVIAKAIQQHLETQD